jgi:hypothetical protein
MGIKSLTLAIALLSLTMHVTGQQLKDSPAISNKTIIGVWQVDTDLVSSAIKANFQFYKEGKFVYNTDSYDDLNPLISISGVYKIDKKILYLKIQSTKQLTGFKVIASEPSFQFGSFQLDGGKIETIKQNDSDYSEHNIKVISDKKASQNKVIKIDSDKYYKVSDNPDKFSK